MVVIIGTAIWAAAGIGQGLRNVDARTVRYPLPHQIPKYPGGVSFRFAMVHDVIHDRYPRHGRTYYEERNRRVLAAIAKNKDADGLPPPAQFGLIDDLGVGLDTLGESEEAAHWLFLKLKAQEKLGLQGRALYTSYANLGTFLIHGNSAKAIQGDAQAQTHMKEGLRYLHQSMEVNPEAHFGREIWQAVIGEFLLAASKNPKLLLEYDMIGNSLEEPVNLRHPRGYPSAMRPGRQSYRDNLVRRVDAFLKNPRDAEESSALRNGIRHVGNNDREGLVPSWKLGPFDEPCLGIIGMWRLGGGANKHFALALGETMMRVKQRHLAWSAYQRAIREAKRFASDEVIRTKFIEHCKKRQEEAGLSEEEVKELAARFESELQVGTEYQRAYQKFEEEQIAAGKDLDDPHFYDTFHAQHGNIATPVGDADFLPVEESGPIVGALLVFIFGATVFLFALVLLVWQRRRSAGHAKSLPRDDLI